MFLKISILLALSFASVTSYPRSIRDKRQISSSSASSSSTSSNSNGQHAPFGIGAAAGIGGLGASAGLGSFQADTKSNLFQPFGAFAGLNLGNGGRIGAGCSGLQCGFQFGDLVFPLYNQGSSSSNSNSNANGNNDSTKLITKSDSSVLESFPGEKDENGRDPERYQKFFNRVGGVLQDFGSMLGSFFRVPEEGENGNGQAHLAITPFNNFGFGSKTRRTSTTTTTSTTSTSPKTTTTTGDSSFERERVTDFYNRNYNPSPDSDYYDDNYYNANNDGNYGSNGNNYNYGGGDFGLARIGGNTYSSSSSSSSSPGRGNFASTYTTNYKNGVQTASGVHVDSSGRVTSYEKGPNGPATILTRQGQPGKTVGNGKGVYAASGITDSNGTIKSYNQGGRY